MRSAVGSIYKYGKNHYRVRVTTQAGRKSRNVRGSRAQAERVMAALLAEGGDRGQDISVADLINGIYLPYAKENVRESTYASYRRYAKRICDSEVGTWMLSSLASHAHDLRDWLREQDTVGGARNCYKVLRQALAYARKVRHLNVEVITDMIDMPRTKPPEKPVVTLSHVREYVDCAAGTPIHAGVIVSLSVGTRRSETCALDWDDFTWDGGDEWFGRVDITRGVHERAGGGIYEEPPKSATSVRTVYFPRWAGEMLYGMRGTGPIMQSDGERVRPDYFTRKWRSCQLKANLRFVPLKNLRHSCATILIRELEVPVADVQQLLGHSSTAVTEGFYLQKSDAPLVRTASAWTI